MCKQIVATSQTWRIGKMAKIEERGDLAKKKAGAASQKKQHDNVRTSYA